MRDSRHDDLLDSTRLAVLAMKIQKPKNRFLWFSKGQLHPFLEDNKEVKDDWTKMED